MAQTKPFFSIIIPALNEEQYLPHLLEDLAQQTFRDFEVILVDGKSVDQTVSKAKKFSRHLPKLTVLTSTRRHVCTQRNLGAKKAKGEYLIFMDADNGIPHYFLQGIKYRLEIEATPAAIPLLYTASQNPKDITIINTLNTAILVGRPLDTPVFLEALIIIQNHLFNQQLGGFDENIDFSEGTDLVRRLRSQNLDYSIYNDPRYEFNLRRIHTFGAFNLITNIAKHQFANLLGEEMSKQRIKELYPMEGGKLFAIRSQKRRRQFTHSIDQLLRYIRIGHKPLTLKQLRKLLS